ncbi:MAG: transglutaminase family protein [Ancalomicrobiaceae bacterium]|nr:transglutaminase family protein [Ancalomicrobiaceae bacterium]
MRLQIAHEVTFHFDTPALYAVQILRMMPRGSSQQFINDWRIDVSADCRLSPVEDPFGNWTHTFSVDGPLDSLTISASGEVMTEETNGVIRGTPERLPLAVYLRETALTAVDADLAAKAADIMAECGSEPITALHALMGWVSEALAPAPETLAPAASPAKALSRKEGTSTDRAHVFVAAARAVGIPARYVSGYLYSPEPGSVANGVHAWAEAYLGGQLGWVGFDPSLNLCPTDNHVRVAVALDVINASPIRANNTGLGETRACKVTVDEVVSHRHQPAA